MEQQKTRVLNVDDNGQVRSALREIFQGQEDVSVVGEACDGTQALCMIEQLSPDVVLLDVVMPKLDGFGVLEKAAGKSGAPAFIMISALVQEAFVLRAVELGATFFLAKPFDAQSVRNRVRDCIALKEGRHIEPRSRTVVRMGEKSVDERISTMFITMGIPAHIKGYTFLREAVKMVIGNPDIINRITKELYPGIARTYDTSASKVERAIRHAIEVAWTRGKIENINDIFGYNVYTRNDKPTNGEFIALIADKLMLENAA